MSSPMILPDRLGELMAGLTPDQEDLLEEVLRSPYFDEDPGGVGAAALASTPGAAMDVGSAGRDEPLPGTRGDER